ncbi:MAG TPA: serine hydrolase domain-containing protein [Mycobacteriales bacterium]|nr:serine hydrolase domain-containing protein [Mycobacteriales bacterium]
MPADRWAALAKELAAPGNPPGSAAAVLLDGEVMRTAAAGVLRVGSPAAVGPDTVFALMSMTKAVTAVAALALVEQGAVALDDPVSRHLPAFGRMRVGGRPAAEPMLVRHLFTHTSGLLRGNGTHPVEDAYGDVGLRPGQPADYTLAEFCDRLATVELAFEPGTAFAYGYSTDVLGRVLEVAAGAPLDEVFDQLVLGPLGLADTGFFAADAARVAILHTRDVPLDDWDVPVARPAMLSGGAGLLSTVVDYARFAAMLSRGGTLDGVRVLSPESVADMRRNQLPGGGTIPALSAIGPEAGTGDPPGTYTGIGHGLGVAVDEHGAHPGEYGWSGASGSLFFVDPVGGLALVVLANRFGPGNAAWRNRLRTLAYRDRPAATPDVAD